VLVDVVAELRRGLHPLALVADRSQLLGEHELVDRDDEGDGGDDRRRQRLERRLDGVALGEDRTDRRRPELDGGHEREEEADQEDPGDQTAVGLQQEPRLQAAPVDALLQSVVRAAHCAGLLGHAPKE
jgi:hypothetical protein